MVISMNMPPSLTEPHRLKLRIEDFTLLDHAGVFDAYGKVELIDGVIEVMNAEFRRHNRIKNYLTRRLQRALEDIGSRYEAFSESSLALPSHDLPQPDVIVARGGSDDRYYEVGDLAIVVEVADSTVARDLGVKCALYSAHGVPEYWVVAVASGEVHQFWDPGVDGFAARRMVPLEGELTSATMPELAIDGRGIL